MAERVTIQDIADALGVSRNTVSKAINNTGILADSTREKVLQKAVEMGYKQFTYITASDLNINKPSPSPAGTEAAREIALFATSFPGNSHFASTMLDKFQKEISQLGYGFTMHLIRPEETAGMKLPITFNKERTAGIIGIEMFDYRYDKMLCDMEIPILFVDCPAFVEKPLKADLLLMDNQSGIYSFVNEMVRRGKEKIGFIGEYMHCQSFLERYTGYRNAMHLLGLSRPENYCITLNKKSDEMLDSTAYQKELMKRFEKMDGLPDVFICANDFVVLDILQVFKKLGISVPKDVWLCGFDDSPESRIITPSLTTIHIHSQIMGVCAVQLLMSRIEEPSLNFRTIHTETNLIYRESTGDGT